VKIINKTHFETRDLRAIFQKAAEIELEPEHRKRLKVYVVYSRGGGMSGCAYIKSNWSKVRIAKHETVNPRNLAYLAAHEFAHCRGMRHRQMPSYLRHWSGSHERYAWAEGMQVRIRPKKKRLTFRALDTDTKIIHARRMHARALTRLKRAQTIEKKWRVKVKYYEKKQTTPLTMAAEHTSC